MIFNIFLEKEEEKSEFGTLPKEVYEVEDSSGLIIPDSEEKDNLDFLRNHQVDIEKALSLLGDSTLYQETLKEFYQSIEERIKKLNNLKEQDLDEFSVLVHSLKSDSKYLGFTRLSEISFELEEKSKEKKKDDIHDNYKKLEEELLKVKDLLDEYYKTI